MKYNKLIKNGLIDAGGKKKLFKLSNNTAIKPRKPLEENRAVTILNLNFIRNKFFPSVNFLTNKLSKESVVFLSVSLGLLNSTFGFKKSQKCSKQSYLRLASFLKRTIMFLGQLSMHVYIKGTPKYIRDILSTMFGKTDKILDSPFEARTVSDSFSRKANVDFLKVYFSKPYDYSNLKTKKKGKPKRKITKKIVKLNNVID